MALDILYLCSTASDTAGVCFPSPVCISLTRVTRLHQNHQSNYVHIKNHIKELKLAPRNWPNWTLGTGKGRHVFLCFLSFGTSEAPNPRVATLYWAMEELLPGRKYILGKCLYMQLYYLLHILPFKGHYPNLHRGRDFRKHWFHSWNRFSQC